MGIGGDIGIGEVAIGIVTLNPAAILDGARRTATSYLIGEITAPIMEPVKETLGNFYADVDWIDIAENCPLW